MLLVYSNKISERLEYIIDVLSDCIQIRKFEITSNKNYYTTANCYKINYSSEKICEEELQIIPHALLFEENITLQNISIERKNEIPYFFKTAENNGFDILAASFYLLVRYDEYLPHTLDEYSRYSHTNSIAFKYNFLHLPLVNIWFNQIETSLNNQLEDKKLEKKNFQFLATYDIDIVYSYKAKSFSVTIVALFRDFLKGNVLLFVERLKVLFNFKNDPSDIFNWLNELHNKYHLPSLYFILFASKKVEYDKNISIDNIHFKKLIKEQTEKNEFGIHPSWQSGDNEFLVQSEIQNLSKLINKDIIKSRQHYIRFKLPATFRKLIAAGIKTDYSMGYGSINGFRASYCLPYKWFDLGKNEKTNLTLVPFCYMDANAIFEQKYSPTEAGKELQHYYDIVKSVNGCLVTIFHNHFLTEQREWKGWRNMYEEFLKENFI